MIYDLMDLVGIVSWVINLLTNLTATFVPVAKQWRAIQRVNQVISQIFQQIVRSVRSL